MPDITTVEQLSDGDLLADIQRTARDARHATAQLLALLAELDVRRLYLSQSCGSLFMFCTRILHLSEHATYHRIEAARAARQFPVILDLVASGAMTLTTVALLRPHLTGENHRQLLDAARHKSKSEVEHQIASLAPRPDQRTLVRRVPATHRCDAPVSDSASEPALLLEPRDGAAPRSTVSAPRPTVGPLAANRYLVKVTVSAETHARLRRAQDLMRHTIPNGDPAAIIDRALALLVEQLERIRGHRASTPRHRPAHDALTPRSGRSQAHRLGTR